MAPGAARSRDDDQKEHHSPDYLRRVHDDWLAGISALPPVLGDSGSADPDMPDPATAPDVEDMPADPPSRSARLHSYYRDDTPPSVHQPATAPAPAGSAEAATSEEPQSLPEAEELPQPQHIDLTDQTPLDERQLPQQDGVTTVSVSGTGPFATHTADRENPSGR